jgi:hypothetical protein
MRALTGVWKSYLVLWVVFRSFSLGTRLLFDPGLQNAAYIALGVAGFIPLLGFVVAKPIFRPGVWRIWLLLLLIWVLFDRTFYSAWFLQFPFDRQFVGVLLAVPAFAATYSYSRPSFRAWTTAA